MLKDFITGKDVLDTPKERVRQRVERFLVDEKDYPRENILVDYTFLVEIGDKKFVSSIDILIKVENRNFMNIECAPPTVFSSLERKALASSRIFKPIIPFTVLTDWQQTKIFETESGKIVGDSLKEIPNFNIAKKIIQNSKPVYLDEERVEKEKRVLFAFMSVLHCECEIFDTQPNRKLEVS